MIIQNNETTKARKFQVRWLLYILLEPVRYGTDCLASKLRRPAQNKKLHFAKAGWPPAQFAWKSEWHPLETTKHTLPHCSRNIFIWIKHVTTIQFHVHKVEVRKEHKTLKPWLAKQTMMDFYRKIKHTIKKADDRCFDTLSGLIFAI